MRTWGKERGKGWGGRIREEGEEVREEEARGKQEGETQRERTRRRRGEIWRGNGEREGGERGQAVRTSGRPRAMRTSTGS